MKIIGLDLSITATGVATADDRTFTVRTRAKDGTHRLNVIQAAIEPVLDGVDLAVIEGPGRFLGNTGHIIGEVHGAVKALLNANGIQHVAVSPASLKSYATGNRSADKVAMIWAAFERGGIKFTDDNECDAWWLRHTGLDRCGQALFKLPAVQRAFLNKVDWPAGVQLLAAGSAA